MSFAGCRPLSAERLKAAVRFLVTAGKAMPGFGGKGVGYECWVWYNQALGAGPGDGGWGWWSLHQDLSTIWEFSGLCWGSGVSGTHPGFPHELQASPRKPSSAPR